MHHHDCFVWFRLLLGPSVLECLSDKQPSTRPLRSVMDTLCCYPSDGAFEDPVWERWLFAVRWISTWIGSILPELWSARLSGNRDLWPRGPGPTSIVCPMTCIRMSPPRVWLQICIFSVVSNHSPSEYNITGLYRTQNDLKFEKIYLVGIGLPSEVFHIQPNWTVAASQSQQAIFPFPRIIVI